MDFKSGSFPVGVVVFGLIALFLALRLRSVLGRRDGLDAPPPRGEIAPRGDATPRREAVRPRLGGLLNPLAPRTAPQPATAPRVALPETKVAPTSYVLPESGSSAGQALVTLGALMPQFDATAFLHGAARAFERVVTAFARGDRDTLRSLLAPEALAAFEAAIAAREAAGETQHAEIRQLSEASLVGAQVGGANGAERPSLEVRFVSDQVSYVTGRNGEPVSGADAVTELCDIWTFEAAAAVPGADAAARPSWLVSATRSA